MSGCRITIEDVQLSDVRHALLHVYSEFLPPEGLDTSLARDAAQAEQPLSPRFIRIPESILGGKL